MYIYQKYNNTAKTSTLNIFRGQNVQGYVAETSVAEMSYNRR